MVPQPQSAARRRIPALAHQSRSNLFSDIRLDRTPLVTYSQKATPLSLTGFQFVNDRLNDRRPTPEDRDESTDALDHLHAHNGQIELPDSAYSSDSESDGHTYSHHSQGASGAPPRREILKSPSAHLLKSNDSKTGQRADGAAKRLPATRTKRLSPPRSKVCQRRGSLIDAPAGRKSIHGAVALRRNQPKAPDGRRLPVNELFLTTSPLHYSDILEPQSSIPGVLTQDPIQDESNVPQRRDSSCDSNERADTAPPVKAPLSVIRKRLRTPEFKYKSMRGAKRKRRTWGSSRSTNSSASKSGDGFEKHELRITHVKPQSYRKRRYRPTEGYAPLQMGAGPLPKVEFVVSTSRLEMELGCTDEAESQSASLQKHLDSSQRSSHASKRVKRVMNFSDRDDMIIAQLSSISAPPRPRSESDDSELGSDDGHEALDDDDRSESLGIASEDDEESGNDLRSEDDQQGRASPAESHNSDGYQQRFQQAAVQPAPVQRSNEGVFLDFRTPGTYTGQARGSLGKSRLIEVAEAIYNAPDEPQLVEGSGHPRSPQRPKPRPILKNSNPFAPDSTTEPKRTAANTRRTSMVEIALDESRYFSNASNGLQALDPTRHIVMSRRPSHLTNRVEVVDSDICIPETSPEPPNYTDASQLHLLRKTSDAVWVS